MNTATIQQRADQLTAALQAEYEKRVAEKSLKLSGQGINPVTEVVAKFLQPGISFAEAEEILRVAGFTVTPHPKSAHPGNVDYRDDVIAQRLISNKFPTSSIAVVTLSPPSQGNYDVVENVTAAFALVSI